MKTKKQLPFILHVDDQPDTLRPWQEQANATNKIHLEVKHPRDVSDDDLSEAAVVLVDVKLEEWGERDEAPHIALQPTNGLALLSILQERFLGVSNDMPRAFALYTGVVGDVARGLVPRPHIIARARNLEWVFDKKTDNKILLDQLMQLAEAVTALPTPWPQDSAEKTEKELREWLGLPAEATWTASAWRSVIDCRPPMHDFAEHTHGIGVLRWMLHKILPYPCFLLEDVQLAASLRVNARSLRHQLADNEEFSKLFEPALYRGQLNSFLGKRWWRSAVDAVAFALVPEDPANLKLLHDRLKEKAPNLKLFKEGFAFPVLDTNYRWKDKLAKATDVVEIVPDDWPPFADAAWALRTDIKNDPSLKAIARFDDREVI